MSVNKSIQKITVPSIVKMKKENKKIAVLTAYDCLMAEMLDEAEIDIILVGDSAGMVVAGFDTTLPVNMEMMLYHTASVKRGVKKALLVADMPFLSYQSSASEAIKNAGRFLQESGAEAVKVEGGEPVADTIKKMVDVGIPVMGHLGLTPQSINKFGCYKLIGKEKDVATQLIKDAKLLEEAGAFSMVLEKIPTAVSKEISESIDIPTIGIGAGPFCDGQVLVSHDMLGIFDKFKPRFVRRYANMSREMRDAFAKYTEDVKSGNFPSEDESY